MKIVDWESKGNVVRFYLGPDRLRKWWGDDWNDAPWDCNAGRVYREFVRGHVDMAFGFEVEVEVCGAEDFNTRWTKDDMRERRVPFLTLRHGTYSSRELFLGDDVQKLDSLNHLEAA